MIVSNIMFVTEKVFPHWKQVVSSAETGCFQCGNTFLQEQGGGNQGTGETGERLAVDGESILALIGIAVLMAFVVAAFPNWFDDWM